MELLKIFAGRSNEALAKDIALYIDKKAMGSQPSVLGRLDSRRNFNDGELYARYDENIRGANIFIIQSTNQPDSHLLELLLMIHTARQASAGHITAVIPYLGYSRQDWKDKSRAPIAVALIARMLHAAGVDRILIIDTHSNVIQGALASLNIQTDHLWARPVFVKYLRSYGKIWNPGRELVVAAPDIHAGKISRGYAENLGNLAMVFIEKRRPQPGESKVLNVIGDVGGRDVLIVDDMIDTAKTTCNAAVALKEKGAKNIYALATHGLFSGDAIKYIQNSPIERVFITDSVSHCVALASVAPKIAVVSIAELLGEAILRIHLNQSVSSLFEEA